jgi:hypothetical protein
VTDAAFVDAFEGGRLRPSEFHHRDHVRLAWILVRRDGLERGGDRVAHGIRAFAARHGVADRYHETITRFWIRLVGHAVAVAPDAAFEDLVERFPILLDASAITRHWSRDALQRPEARAHWLEPDLAPLPG